jgi:sugar/nucleoside kinase (ribokinase family)
MSKQRGGIAPNIAYTMALLGQKPRVMATVGEDFGDYRAWLEFDKGVDTTLMKVVPGVSSPPRSSRRRIMIPLKLLRSTRGDGATLPLNRSRTG